MSIGNGLFAGKRGNLLECEIFKSKSDPYRECNDQIDPTHFTVTSGMSVVHPTLLILFYWKFIFPR